MDRGELTQIVFNFLGAGGGLLLLLQSIRTAFRWLSGRDGRARIRRKSIEQERDDADAYRRVIAEHASRWRRMLLEAGIDPGPWPRNPNDNPEGEGR